MEAATAALIAQIVATTSAVAGTAMTVTQAIKANKNAKAAKERAAERATIERIQNNAQAAQQKGLAQRRLLIQLDAMRVGASAAGVTGGTNELVLESAYVRDAREDIATISGNQFNRNRAIGFGLDDTFTRINSQTPSVGAAAFQGAAHGLTTYLDVQRGLASTLTSTAAADPATSQTPAADLPPEQVDSSIYDPATDQ